MYSRGRGWIGTKLELRGSYMRAGMVRLIIMTCLIITIPGIQAIAGEYHYSSPSLSIFFVGGTSISLEDRAYDHDFALHVGGGAQVRLNRRASNPLSLVVRLDYYRYPGDIQVGFAPPIPSYEGYEREDGHFSMEAELMMTFVRNSNLHPYLVAGFGVRELSGLVCGGVGADLPFLSFSRVLPFVEFRATVASISSLQLDGGIRMGL